MLPACSVHSEFQAWRMVQNSPAAGRYSDQRLFFVQPLPVCRESFDAVSPRAGQSCIFSLFICNTPGLNILHCPTHTVRLNDQHVCFSVLHQRPGSCTMVMTSLFKILSSFYVQLCECWDEVDLLPSLLYTTTWLRFDVTFPKHLCSVL